MPGSCQNLSPSKDRGRRESRVRAAPAVSCAMCTKKCAHEHTGPAESIRPSLRNGLTVRAGGMAVFLEARPCDRGPKHSLICPAGQVGSNPPYALMIVRLFLNSRNLAGGD